MKKFVFVVALLFLVSSCASRRCCNKRYVKDTKPKVELKTKTQQFT